MWQGYRCGHWAPATERQLVAGADLQHLRVRVGVRGASLSVGTSGACWGGCSAVTTDHRPVGPVSFGVSWMEIAQWHVYTSSYCEMRVELQRLKIHWLVNLLAFRSIKRKKGYLLRHRNRKEKDHLRFNLFKNVPPGDNNALIIIGNVLWNTVLVK